MQSTIVKSHSNQTTPTLLNIICLLACINAGTAFAQTDLGLVSLKSIHACYLQAKTDGEMHASNKHHDEEETWHLIEVDKPHHIYALLNWRNHMYMSKSGACVPANKTVLTRSEQFILVSGVKYEARNAVALKSVADGAYIGGGVPGEDNECHGEVGGTDKADPPYNNGLWPGWWVIESVGEPKTGDDFWTGIGKVFDGIATKVSGADVVALIGLLAL